MGGRDRWKATETRTGTHRRNIAFNLEGVSVRTPDRLYNRPGVLARQALGYASDIAPSSWMSQFVTGYLFSRSGILGLEEEFILEAAMKCYEKAPSRFVDKLC